jgi:hypothetical protein
MIQGFWCHQKKRRLTIVSVNMERQDSSRNLAIVEIGATVYASRPCRAYSLRNARTSEGLFATSHFLGLDPTPVRLDG